MRRQFPRLFGKGRDMRRCRSAAAADHVKPTVAHPFQNLRGERLGCFGKSSFGKRIGQTGVWIGTDKCRTRVRELLQERLHFIGTERTIETDYERPYVLNGIQESFHRLPT